VAGSVAQPNPDRKHVNKIAFALAMGYDRKGRTDYNSSKLDILLNQLLEAVGMAAISGAPKKGVWLRLAHQEPAERTLVTGWVNYPPFSYGDEVPSGLAVEIMQRIGLFMGCRLEWRRYSWSKILAALEKREIDIICPILLVLPTRMFHARFADPLPELRIWLNGVVHQPNTFWRFSEHTPQFGASCFVLCRR
jgi:hypothetical protein